MRRIAVIVAAVWLIARPTAALTSDDLFDRHQLQDVWVHINAADWDRLRETFTENTFYPCDVEWRDLKVRNAGCRSRGFGSRSGTKPGLYVDFDHYVAGQTFLGLDGVVLDNLSQDPSMMAERLSMQLFERMGLPAPRQAYARLYVGSGRDYGGVYAVVEEIARPFLQRRFGSGDGYLYEYRWTDEYRFEDLGAELEAYARRFEPRTRARESMFDLYAPIRELVSAINEAASTDLPAALEPHVDLGALIRHLAVENYVSEWDGLVGYAGLDNFYLYRDTSGEPFQVLAWDKDATFTWLEMPPWHNFETNILTVKIWAHRALRARYLDTLLEIAAASGDLDDEVAEAYEQIRGAATADPVKPYSDEQFEGAVSNIRRFVRDRPGVVRAFIAALRSPAQVGSGVAGP